MAKLEAPAAKAPGLFRISFRIRASVGGNSLLYFFSRLPLIGRLLPESAYAAGGLKTAVTAVSVVLQELWGVIKKLAYLMLMVLMPATWLKTGEFTSFGGLLPEFVHILFWLSGVFMLFNDSQVMKATKDKFICIRYMRADPRRYMLATVPFGYAVFFAAYLPPLILCTLLAGGTVGNAFSLWLMVASFRAGTEAFQLWWYKHFRAALFRKTTCVFPAAAVCLAAAYLPLAAKWPVPEYLFLLSLPGALVLAAGGAACVWYVFWGYGDWRRAIVQNLRIEYVVPNQGNAQAAFRDVQMKEEDLSATPQQNSSAERKKGYAYFNALFFTRHRRLLFRPVLIRLAVVGGLFLAAAVALFLLPERLSPLMLRIPELLPMLVFILYFTSMAPKACKAMFYNCDNSMLRYAFYRRAPVILQNFNIRLRYVAGYNLLVGLGICVAVCLLTILAGGTLASMEMAAFCLSVLLLSVFFSVHHMFLYYVFQPYTSELNVKNPVYSFINMVVYMACFACFQIQTAGMSFAFGVLGVTVLYMAVALVLVYRFSPKKFRVK